METESEKFRLIHDTIQRDNNLLTITYLCDVAGVSRSGYYNWINNQSKRNEQDYKDQQDFELILQAYKYRGYNKGARSIHMRLLRMGIRMNIKKIRRLMKKYNLFCPIRKANPYRRMMKALKSDIVAEDLVKRNFKQAPRKVILTDITYLFYGKERNKAYLSVMKDAFTKQVLSYVLSESLAEAFVLETINKLIMNHKDSLLPDTLVHSDQGSHYTCVEFRKLLSNKELIQSMSRKGNCWDNAPQESFFGHMKDEIDVTDIDNFKRLTEQIDDYMDYYNNDRYQWELAKLSPNEFYEYITTGIYPIIFNK